MNVLDWLNQIVLSLMNGLGYPGLGIVMFIETVFPPIPSEVVLPLAGHLCNQGLFTLWGITLVGSAGSVAGAWLFYGLGNWLGEQTLREFFRRYGRWVGISEKDFQRAVDWFNRHGDWVVFFGRMVPLVRSLISIPAGINQMNWFKFSVLTAFGTALWSFSLAFAGQILGQNWELVPRFMEQYQNLVLILVVLGIGIFAWKRIQTFLSKQKTSERPL